MKTNSPTHEAVTQRAHEIWETRGRPTGCDTEIWLDAERQLSASASGHDSPSDAPGRGNGTSSPGETTAKAVQQKKAARAPKLPAKSAPKASPPETGKPLWDKPHSS